MIFQTCGLRLINLGHLGYFLPNYQHYFGNVKALFVGKLIWLYFLKKDFGVQA
jgi:hypothetical protein